MITSAFSVDEAAEDTYKAFMNLGFDKVTLMGASYGGMIAMLIAIRHPEQVHDLILCIISVIWRSLPAFEKLRRNKGVPYTACFVESWASRWGEGITGEKAFWD